jgi:tyrosinase
LANAADDWFIRNTPSPCSGRRLRVAFGSMSYDDRMVFARTVYQMKFYNGQFLSGQSTSLNLYDVFQQMHQSPYNAQLHGTSTFVPQHKAMLWLFESALRMVCQRSGLFTIAQCCKLALPYWDWLLGFTFVSGMTNGGYWGNMHNTDVFEYPDIMGDATPGPNSYIDEGLFAASGQFDPPGRDLRRGFIVRNLNNATNPRTMANWIVNNPRYVNFLPYIHGSMHGQFHTYIGYEMSNTDTAARDPLFWMHHCNVDRLFHLWADCHGYETITESTLSMPTHYVEQNPIGLSGTPKTYPSGTIINVGVDTRMDLRLTATYATFLSANEFPTPKQMFEMGPNAPWGGVNYRYGPDSFIAAQNLDTRCPNKVWSWVNQNS